MTALVIILMFIFGFINILMHLAVNQSLEKNIDTAAAASTFAMTNSKFGFPFSSSQIIGSEELKSIKYISAFLDSDGNISSLVSNMTDDLTTGEMTQIATGIMNLKRDKGSYSHYKYRMVANGNDRILVIVDTSAFTGMLSSLAKISVFIIIISMIIEFTVVVAMSKKAIKPLEEAFDKQKQFISDASHELKTPLSVISASADVLEAEEGENKWLTSIKEQTDNMSHLVYSLLDLAKLDEMSKSPVMADFDLSSAVLNIALEFECPAFESGKELTYDIKPDIHMCGNEQNIKQIITILTENAVKYADEHGKIEIRLRTSGKQKIIEVYNTGKGIRDDERDKIFQRFYRSDASRSRSTGGYGLGLAIAKSLVTANNGTISVTGVEGQWIRFTVIFQNGSNLLTGAVR